MEQRKRLTQWICMLIIGTFMITTAYIPIAQAEMVTTQSMVQERQLEQQREELKALLERDDVRQQLVGWGVDPQEARDRVDRLSEAEVAEMAERLEQMPAGAGVLNALLFVFLVLLVTDILGFTDVFPFVRSTQR